MYTPNEIAEKKFDKVMLWGYDMNAVDSFIESVSADYSQLYKENITLKSKMKVLVSKIEEYRAVDESMREALLNARTRAEEMTKNAELAAANLRAEAEAKASARLSEIEAEMSSRRAEAEAKLNADIAALKERIALEEMRLEEAKTKAQAFIDKTIALYSKELDSITSMRSDEFNYEVKSCDAPAKEIVEDTPAMAEVNQETEPPVREGGEDILPDTVALPDLPPVPASAMPTMHGYQPKTTVYESDSSGSASEQPRRRIEEVVAERRAANAQQPGSVDDGEETIVLSPKPKFEFNNLQFGEKYSPTEN